MEKRNTEKRGDHRHTLALDTEVHFNEKNVEGMFRCRTKNIGLQGAFLPSKAIPITSDTNIELILMAGTHPVPKQYRLQAHVVRSSDEGTGLVFSELNNEQQLDFRRFLYKAKVAARYSN